MEPLNKLQNYATAQHLKYVTVMQATNTKTSTPSIRPVFTAQLSDNANIFITYIQTTLNDGTLLVQHINPNNKTIIQALSKDITNNRKLNITHTIQEMINDLFQAEQETHPQADAES